MGIVAFPAMGLIGFYELTWAAAGVMFEAGLSASTGFTLLGCSATPFQKDRLGSTWFV